MRFLTHRNVIRNAGALADADEAVRRRPTWPKGHFRRAEALTQAGLHADALVSYEAGAALDPSDAHLQSQCVEARARDAAATRADQTHVGIGAAVGIVVVLLLLFLSAETGVGSQVGGLLAGGCFGALGGVAFVALRRQQRGGSILPPLQSNEHFAALQMKGDRDGAGELKSTVLADAANAAPPPAVGMFSGGGGGGLGSGGGAPGGGGGPPAAKSGSDGSSAAKRRVKSSANGRAAALKAMGR